MGVSRVDGGRDSGGNTFEPEDTRLTSFDEGI